MSYKFSCPCCGESDIEYGPDLRVGYAEEYGSYYIKTDKAFYYIDDEQYEAFKVWAEDCKNGKQ